MNDLLAGFAKGLKGSPIHTSPQLAGTQLLCCEGEVGDHRLGSDAVFERQAESVVRCLNGVRPRLLPGCAELDLDESGVSDDDDVTSPVPRSLRLTDVVAIPVNVPALCNAIGEHPNRRLIREDDSDAADIL
ncbi:hypothetical protein M3F76_04990 [Dietzia cinnamea]|nr:hypothetical protein [Dietzia cinnamea]MCT2273828.1 hypothetical protein [Dietzia cinnamea]